MGSGTSQDVKKVGKAVADVFKRKSKDDNEYVRLESVPKKDQDSEKIQPKLLYKDYQNKCKKSFDKLSGQRATFYAILLTLLTCFINSIWTLVNKDAFGKSLGIVMIILTIALFFPLFIMMMMNLFSNDRILTWSDGLTSFYIDSYDVNEKPKDDQKTEARSDANQANAGVALPLSTDPTTATATANENYYEYLSPIGTQIDAI